MSHAMVELRPVIRAARNIDQPRRAEAFRELASEGALETLEHGGIEALRGWLFERFPELK
jgi:hypothetical protein